MNKNLALLFGMGSALLLTSGQAHAADFSFGNITGGDTEGDSIVGAFKFSVTNPSTGKVRFDIKNTFTGADDPHIKQVVFSWQSVSALLSSPVLNSANVGAVNFAVDQSGRNYGNLPQSNNLGTSWYGSDFAVKNQGIRRIPTLNGIASAVQPGESLGLVFDGNFNDVITALNNQTLRLGIHVGAIGRQDCSDSYVSVGNPQPVPESSGAAVLGLAGLGIVGFLKKKASVA